MLEVERTRRCKGRAPRCGSESGTEEDGQLQAAAWPAVGLRPWPQPVARARQICQHLGPPAHTCDEWLCETKTFRFTKTGGRALHDINLYSSLTQMRSKSTCMSLSVHMNWRSERKKSQVSCARAHQLRLLGVEVKGAEEDCRELRQRAAKDGYKKRCEERKSGRMVSREVTGYLFSVFVIYLLIQ